MVVVLCETNLDRDESRHPDDWMQAVNQQGGFGRWRWDVAKQPGEILDILAKHSAAG
jgi:hypothetical protein